MIPYRASPLLLVLAAWSAGVALFWAFPILPFQDLAAHAGMIATRARLASMNAPEASVLVYWPQLGTYSLFRALGAVLAAPLGPLGAVRALATVTWTAYPLALVWARRRTCGDWSATAAFVGMLLGLGFMTLLGFASYQLAAAIVLVANAEWIRLLQAPRSTRQGALCAALALLLVVAHAYAFALFVVLALIAWSTAGRALRALPWLFPAFVSAAYSVWSTCLHTPPMAAAVPVVLHVRFSTLLEKLELLVSPTLMTRFGLDAAVSLALWALAFVRIRRDFRGAAVKRVLARQAALTFVAFLVLPHAIGAFGFVDARLLPTVLALALLGYDFPAPSAAAATFAVLGCDLFASARFQFEAVGTEILQRVPAGARLLHLPLDPDSNVFAAHPFLHTDKLALVERPLIVSDVWFHQGTALYPTPAHPALRLPRSYPYSVLGSARWNEYQWDDWDYVLIRTRIDSAEAAGIPARLVRIDHVGGFWLYHVQKAE